MNSTINALRAITAITVRRILTPAVWLVGFILAVMYLGVIYLATEVDPWWTLLLILIVPLTVIAVVIGGGLWGVTTVLLPKNYNGDQNSEIVAFTDKLMGIVEAGQTPYPVHLFLIAKDVLRGKDSRHVRNMIDNSKSLRHDFDKLKKSF